MKKHRKDEAKDATTPHSTWTFRVRVQVDILAAVAVNRQHPGHNRRRRADSGPVAARGALESLLHVRYGGVAAVAFYQ